MGDFYLIQDTTSGKFFCEDTDYIPWIVYAFTDDFRLARFYRTLETAKAECERMTDENYGYDGNTPLEKGRLSVMKVELAKV